MVGKKRCIIVSTHRSARSWSSSIVGSTTDPSPASALPPAPPPTPLPLLLLVFVLLPVLLLLVPLAPPAPPAALFPPPSNGDAPVLVAASALPTVCAESSDESHADQSAAVKRAGAIRGIAT